MYKYQEGGRYFAQIADGLEELGAEELELLGAKDISLSYRGMYFSADQETLYRINYCSRLFTRVLAPLVSFKCHDEDYLYKKSKEVPWKHFLGKDNTFAVFSVVTNSRITHSKYAALKLKDAIADYFRDNYGQRPDVDTKNPDVWVNLFIDNNYATISIDTSGGSLHKRGYRTEIVDAPIQETTAAAIVKMTGWDGETRLYDPMCGSGTLLIEAMMSYCRIPANYLRRKFGFMQLPDYEKETWAKVKADADKAIRELPHGLISGSDKSQQAITAAKGNLRNLPGASKINLRISNFEKLSGFKEYTIIANPPYGIRMSENEKVRELYISFGNFLKKKCTGCTAFVYAGERKYIPFIRLKPDWRKPLKNSQLDGRLVKIKVF